MRVALVVLGCLGLVVADVPEWEKCSEGIAKWSHIRRFYELDNSNPNFVYAPSLTKDHLDPNSKQKMRVKLAAQVLSHSVAGGMYTKISDVSDDVCSISGISVDPCKDPNACKFKKGHQATIDIDYTPSFGGSKIKTGFFWASPNGDVPFAELHDADACQFTACPVQANAPAQFHYGLYVGKKLPTGTFPLKWKLWHEDDHTQMCCFKMNVRLAK